ncbi:tetratricopeptide repeat protein [Marinobacter sp. VGCF2001]|uniref:tetratricopeptide repeat protein n=1 Tax=Marinobacter sp. VGCF2001 TaxID=3417189 RepID=UPI003CF19A56
MKIKTIARASLLSAAIALTVTGCNNEPDMSQDDIQYISHVDQARFFQRQGELKASTIEARSAIDIQPERPAPYFVIINNLLTAGDAANAERQLDKLLENTNVSELSQSERNQAAIIRAEAQILQGQSQQALEALNQIASPSPDQQLQADNLRGRAWLTSGDFAKAEQAYQAAFDTHNNNVVAMVGLSRVAMARGDVDTAQERLEQATTIDAEHEELWLWKAQFAHARQQWAEAERAYIRALETIGQFDVMTFRKYQTISALVTVLREQGKSAEAFVYEEILAKSGPGTIKSNLEAASAAYNEGDLDEAARFLQEVLNQVPNHQQSALMLGVIRFRQGRSAEAEKLLEPLTDMENAEDVRKLLAATRISMRDPEGAKSLLEGLEGKDADPQTLALVGIASLASGDDQSGRRLLEKSLELAPDNHNLRLRYAAYLTQTGDYTSAIDQARKIPDDATEALQATILTSRAQALSGNAEASKNTLDTWLQANPDSLAVLIARGNLAASLNNLQQAASYFERARKQHPEAAAPLVALGNLARNQGQTEEAVAFYKQAIDAQPDNLPAIQAIAGVMEREALTGFMREINAAHPDANGPRLILLESALISGDTVKADELTAQLMERQREDQPSAAEPMVAAVYEGIATQMAQRDSTERALTILSRGRALFPESEPIALKVAAIEFNNGNATAARNALQDAKQHHPNSPAPYQVEASYYENQGEYQQAAELYQLAIAKRHTPELAVAYARALVNAGRTQSALESLQKAKTQFPNHPAILLNLALQLQQAGQTEPAISHYQQALARNPDNPLALNNLAWLYYEAGNAEAVDLAKRAYELAPENAAIADTYGWILFESGEREQSLAVLEKAHALAPESQEIAMHLAEAYRAAGRTTAAQQLMDKFSSGTNG